MRPDDGLRHPFEHDLAVGIGLGFAVRKLRARRGRLIRRIHAGMGMRARDQHVLHGDTGRLGGELLGLGHDLLRHAEIIDHDPGELGLAVIHHQGACAQGVVRAGRGIGAETSRHVHRELLRRDVRHGGTGLQGRRRQVRGQTNG